MKPSIGIFLFIGLLSISAHARTEDSSDLSSSTESTDCKTYDNSQREYYIQQYSVAELRTIRDECFNLYRELTNGGRGRDNAKSIWADDTGNNWDMASSIKSGRDSLEAAKKRHDDYCNNPNYYGVKDTPYCRGN